MNIALGRFAPLIALTVLPSCVGLVSDSAGGTGGVELPGMDAGAGGAPDSGGGGTAGLDAGPDPMPPPPIGGELTTLTVHNLEAAVRPGLGVTFAMPFRRGALPAGRSVALVPPVPVQVDVKATHDDGSVRHAIITLQADFAASERKTFSVRAAEAPGTSVPISVSALEASGWDVEATLNVAGTALSASGLAAVKSAQAWSWLSGPLVSEWIARGALPSHPHLAVYFHVRAFRGLRQVRTDVVVENGWFKASDNRDYTYDATVRPSSGPAWTRAGMRHHAGARWHKALWLGEAKVFVELDRRYLESTHAIPRFANVVPATTGLLQSADPLTGGDFGFDMGAAGDSDWLGPMPRWDATYFTAMDARSFNWMRANNDAAGVFGVNGRYISSGVGVHMRDPASGLPPTLDAHPRASAGDPVPDGIADANSTNPYLKDTAHQPLVGYSPYLVTGDYYHLEEMAFWNAYNLMEPEPSERAGAKGLWSQVSLRGMGWSYRSLGYAVFIFPDAHPLKSYFAEKLANNLARDVQLAAARASNPFGTWPGGEANTEYRSFMDDFFTWSIGNLVDLGFTDALPVLAYKSRFALGRMGGTGGSSNGYCFQAAPAYTHPMGPTAQTLYSSWAQVYAQVTGCTAPCQTVELSRCLGLDASDPFAMAEGQALTDYYYAEMQPALAAAVDHGFGSLGDHWYRFTAARRLPDWTTNPKFAVVPRSLP